MALSRTDPFYSPKRRLLRAQKQLQNLDRKIKRFLSAKPYKLLSEPDVDQAQEILKFQFTKRLPVSCDDLAFEALFTMRSVLDQTAYAAAVASGIERPKRAYFPIAKTAADLENGIKGHCADVPKPVQALFRRFEPYQGGNGHALWVMNQLRNSAHTVLLGIGVAGANVVIRHWGDSEPLDGLNPVWDSLKNEIKFARGRKGQKANYQIHPTFVVGFDHIEIVGRSSAINVLDAAFGKVKRVLLETEAECRRLGFIKWRTGLSNSG
jgi:hypothetical protein